VRPRVFVSSVVKGFEEYREAARRGIIQAGGEPVLVNEDFPALDTSSRNACLDGVDSCDIYTVVVGERGGWTAPSGKLVVEEEYDQARKGKKRILAFIQNVDRDDDANRFVAALSDYTDGLFRRSFETVGELEAQVANAVTSIVNHSIVDRIQPVKIQEKLNERFEIPSASRLRIVIAPERDEEVIDVVRLDSVELRRQLLELGHAREVDLFSYEHAKSTEVQIDSCVIQQTETAGRASGNSFVRLEISSCGLVSIDTNVTGRIARGSLHGFGEGFVIVEADVIQCLQSSFAFVNAMYELRRSAEVGQYRSVEVTSARNRIRNKKDSEV
jgi:hypothetical protein